MTDIDTDKLRALEEVTNCLVATLGRIPEDSPDHARLYLDMTHGEGRENLAAILAMAEENKLLREALEEIAKGQVLSRARETARRALGKEPKA